MLQNANDRTSITIPCDNRRSESETPRRCSRSKGLSSNNPCGRIEIIKDKGRFVMEERQEVGGGHPQPTLERVEYYTAGRSPRPLGRRLTDDNSIPTLALPRLIARRKTGRTNNADDGRCCTSVKGCARHVEIESKRWCWCVCVEMRCAVPPDRR